MSWFKRIIMIDDFTATDNCGKTFSNEIAPHQKAKAQKALEHLIANGHITNWDVFGYGLTDGRKLFSDWRKAGYLWPVDVVGGHDDVPNKTSGRHRVHYWTGKKPENKKEAQ